jgi:hypothetical protein
MMKDFIPLWRGRVRHERLHGEDFIQYPVPLSRGISKVPRDCAEWELEIECKKPSCCVDMKGPRKLRVERV